MENLLPVIGYVGTGIVIGAYVPQIWHLWCEQCSAGISERAYALWVVSSALFLGHSIILDDMVHGYTARERNRPRGYPSACEAVP